MDHADVLQQAATRFGLTAATPITSGGQKLVASADRAGTKVVVKVVLLVGAPDPNALERCEREVSLLKAMNHPNIVQVLSDLEILGLTT